MIKQTNLTAIMLVQQLDDEYWLDFDTEPLENARDGNCRLLLEAVIKKLNNNDIQVVEAHGIIHDKDELLQWNQEKMENEIVLKTKHVHFLLKFSRGASLEKLALTIGVEPQYLEKLKSGRYGFDNCLAYLVHAKDESKYQYNANEVVTILGEDYLSIYNRRIQTWIKGRATKIAKETNFSVDWLVSEILEGRITKSNILLTNEYYTIYGQHKRKINEALETVGERKSYQAITDIENNKFKKTIIFITAESGKGKTRLSKEFIKIVQTVAKENDQTWESCTTASTNAFDEYNGQDILFLDDLRGESLTVSDWLKLLDPYTISPISARYHNKMGSAKLIIITSTKEPIEFFSVAKGNILEDIGQFVRRIDLLVSLDNDIQISEPTKNEQQAKNLNFSFLRGQSFVFSKYKKFNKKNAMKKLVTTVIENMQWNKKKELVFATDQDNEDKLNNQTK